MSDIVIAGQVVSGSSASLLPVRPRVEISIRLGTMADVAFMDALQRKTTRQVGWMPTKQFEGKVNAGQVLVAEGNSGQLAVDSGQFNAGESGQLNAGNASAPLLSTANCPLSTLPRPVGYLIGQDQYFKRDDVGVIYQINVIPEMRRSLVAAMLLKAQFEQSAYGCKLYCCWCAQDIEANRFWESMGFVPLAYRAGSRKGKAEGGRMKDKGKADGGSADPSFLSSFTLQPSSLPTARVHIFWQKRIRQGDTTTPWWFPSKTSGGSIREDRIVLPIPPGVKWSDVMPVVLPGGEEAKLIEEKNGNHGRAARGTRKPKIIETRHATARNGVFFSVPRLADVNVATATEAVKKEKPVRVAKKHDPKLVTAARELRDRWLDAVNTGTANVALPVGKYDVCRELDATQPAMKRLVA